MPSRDIATIRQIKRVAGHGGHVSYDVEVQTDDGRIQQLTFSGSIFVGPVILSIRSHDGQWSREAIDEPRRFGEFASADWVSHYLNSGRRAVTSAYASD
ncbi:MULTISPECIES: hypothetical protein [unclassified Mycolicibacterium]|uniref:hypothetical protein n=1 Tax=unclassified Mycolicibacterium TaxID=2636767 RepID=UPI001F4C5187|nr:hypothetical protein [Mycolicibacterium sp. YH-1]UNB52989.1 hypothetical protein L0M16_00980 [Mycolicibacterium sp. YH-1]